MEDLGHIDINIRDLGGGGSGGGGGGGGGGRGGAGTAGGGPGPVAPPAAAQPVQQAKATTGAMHTVPTYQQWRQQMGLTGALSGFQPWQYGPSTPSQFMQGQQINALRQQMTNAPSFRLMMESLGRSIRRGTLPRVGLQQASMIGEIGGEVSGFMRSPSIAGFARLASTSSATGSALSGLAASVSAIAPIILGVVAVIAAVVLGLMALRWAAKHTAERIAEVGKYSGKVMAAVAAEQIAQINRNLREAATNGERYAAAQRMATMAADAWAKTATATNRLLANMAILWHALSATIATLLEPIMQLVADVSDLLTPLKVIMGSKDGTPGWVMTLFKYALFPAFALIGDIASMIHQVLVKLGIIANNTKPQGGAAVNQWYLADVQAMTGRPY